MSAKSISVRSTISLAILLLIANKKYHGLDLLFTATGSGKPSVNDYRLVWASVSEVQQIRVVSAHECEEEHRIGCISAPFGIKGLGGPVRPQAEDVPSSLGLIDHLRSPVKMAPHGQQRNGAV
jgi:hypothetical protein